MANKRMWFAVKAAGVSICGLNTFTTIHGLQSIGTNTRFSLDPVFEHGQLETYELVEGIPDVDATLEKVLDGYPPLYMLFTRGATSASLTGRSNIRATLGISFHTDTQDNSSGTPLAQCTMSGVYVSSLQYRSNVQGPATESVTVVGNNKKWITSAFTFTPSFTGTDEPLAIAGSGGVQFREDILFGSSQSLLPLDIPGITASGTNELDAEGNYTVPFQSITVSTNLGREQLFQLGKKKAYHRYINFPVEVSCEMEVLSLKGDMVDALEDAASNLANRTIDLRFREGLRLNLGSRNKLQTITQQGGNAQANGGNQTDVYRFTNQSSMTVTHPQDPSGL